MIKRRDFLKSTSAKTLGLGISVSGLSACADKVSQEKITDTENVRPLILSTWKNIKANEAAWQVLAAGGSALDAVEAGVRIPEADPNDTSVGYGGLPDRDGRVTLDACIMDSQGNYGAVACLEEIKHPISVARKVMEETPHVLMVGQGAQDFALSQGFQKESLFTENSKKAYSEWLKKAEYKPKINIELHDTIGMLAIDQAGNISGACTTSGLAYKMAGRVGDSPIIGAGLFVDNEIGAATATGMGEAVLRSVGSFLIVELMRQGANPMEACYEAVMRIVRKQEYKDLQVGYIAINKKGEVGSFAIQPGFVFAQNIAASTTVNNVKSHI